MRALVIASLALFGPHALAHAQPGTSIERGTVEIHVAGTAVDRAWMLAHLAGMIEQLDVDVRYVELDRLAALDVLDPPAHPSAARARVWIDLQQQARAKVYVVDAPWERVLVRPLQLAGGLDEVAAEEIGTIVESSVRALLEGGSIGIARERLIEELIPPQPDPIVEPTTPPAPAPRFAAQLELTAGYGATGWATDLVQHGPLVQLGIAARRKSFSAGGRLEGRVVVPVRHDADAFALRLAGGGARALATIGWHVADRIALESAIGGGFELVTLHATPRTTSAEPFAARRNALGVLALAFGPAFELGRGRDRVLLRAQLGVDVVPHRLRYVTADSDAVLLAPWIVRPGGTLVIGWRRSFARYQP